MGEARVAVAPGGVRLARRVPAGEGSASLCYCWLVWTLPPPQLIRIPSNVRGGCTQRVKPSSGAPGAPLTPQAPRLLLSAHAWHHPHWHFARMRHQAEGGLWLSGRFYAHPPLRCARCARERVSAEVHMAHLRAKRDRRAGTAVRAAGHPPRFHRSPCTVQGPHAAQQLARCVLSAQTCVGLRL